MRIGIVGTGNIGGTLARLLVHADHEVVLANSRGPQAVAGLVAELRGRATASTAAGAAEAGDVVIIAVPFPRLGGLPAPSFAGKIVVDANNDWTGPGPDPSAASSSEVVAAMLAGAKVVKAFNTVEFVQLREEGTPAGTPGRRAIAIAGDDRDAKPQLPAWSTMSASTPTTSAPLPRGAGRWSRADHSSACASHATRWLHWWPERRPGR